jgi:hypothetical protein
MIGMENSDSLLAAKAKLQERILKGQPAPAQKVNRLKPKDIQECRAVFANRWNHYIEDHHVRNLAAAIKLHPDQPLAPIVVYWIGDAYCVIDGHHRLDAYRRLETKRQIPVVVFSGKLDDAMLKSISLNSRDKLPMTKTEKCNAAWRLIIATDKSKADVAKATGVSYGFVGSLRRMRKALLEKHKDIALDSLNWDEARRLEAGDAPSDYEDLEWRKEEAKKIADKMSKTFGDQLRKDYELTYEALALYCPRMMDFFVEYHQPAPDEMTLPVYTEDDGQSPEF